MVLSRWVRPLLLACGLISVCISATYASLEARVEWFTFNQPLFNQPAGEIYGQRTIGQSFLAAYPGLYRIDPLLATYRRANSEDVIFHLRKGGMASEDLVTITIEGPTIEDNSYRSFIFPPQDDSAGALYLFLLESPSSTPGNAITVWSHDHDVYPAGRMYVEGAPTDGDLAFRLYYRGKIAPTFNSLLSRLAEGKPTPLNRWWLYGLLALLYPALASVLVYAVGRGEKGRS